MRDAAIVDERVERSACQRRLGRCDQTGEGRRK
jgi:hypothetical protein